MRRIAVAIEHLNPDSLYRSPVFSQGTVIPAGSRLVIVGGQDGVGADGRLVGDGIAAQTEQAMRNLLAVLEAAGAGPADVAKLTIYLVEGVDVNEAFAASRSVWGDQPTAVSAAFVRGLAVPGALVEVDAIAAVSRHPRTPLSVVSPVLARAFFDRRLRGGRSSARVS
jgi:2-iminobutanoate/2-iminopropanoate deaminase